MDPLRIAIVEDEESNQKILQDYLERLSKEKGILFKIAVFNNGVAFLNNYQAEYDLVFMDIQMPFENGIEVSKALREKDKYVAIIFVTNFVDYAVNGYEVNALDYIVKPIDYYDFALKINKALGLLKKHREKETFLMISTSDGYQKIPIMSIRYVESNKHTVIFHTLDGEIRKYASIKSVEKMLPENVFVRCNSCYIVNLNYVTRIDKYDLFLDKESLVISHPRKKEVIQRLVDFAKEYGGAGGGGNRHAPWNRPSLVHHDQHAFQSGRPFCMRPFFLWREAKKPLDRPCRDIPPGHDGLHLSLRMVP